VLDQLTAGIADEEPSVGEPVADADEFVDAQLEVAEDLLETSSEVCPREATVVQAHEAQRVVAVEPPAAQMETSEVRSAAEPVFQELEVVVDPRLLVIQVLVIDE